jgi:hypothetical protein
MQGHHVILCYKMFVLIKKIKCYKFHLKIILINKFFEINFLKTFVCSKKNQSVQKKNTFFTLIFFLKLCVRHLYILEGERSF